MRGLETRARRIGAAAVARARGRIAARIVVPGVSVTETERGVVLSGRALLRRLATDERLRWIGGLFR